MNFCSKCGSTIMPGSNVCQNCGEPVIFNNNAMPQPMMEQPIPTPEVQMPMGNSVPTTPEFPMNQGFENTVPMSSEVNVVPNMDPMAEVPVTAMAPQVPAQPELPMNQGFENAVPMPSEVNVVPNMAPMAEVLVTAMEPQVPAQPELPANQGFENAVPMPPAVPLEPNQVIEQPKAEVQKESKKAKKDKPELTDEEKEKKFNKITTIVVIVVSIIAIALMGFFMYKALFVKEEETGIQIKNATQYNYEGFEFYLPEGTTASVEDGLFVVKATDNSWSAIITIQEGSYNTLVSNKSQISGYFENLGYVSGEAVEDEVSGMGFVTTEVLIGSQNVLVAYAKASGTKVYGILYVNELSTYDNYSLKTVGEILASGNNRGDLASMPAGFTVEMFEQTFEVAR